MSKCVHTEHCCIIHGCKYGEQDCPVVTKRKDQSYFCEDCEDEGIVDKPTKDWKPPVIIQLTIYKGQRFVFDKRLWQLERVDEGKIFAVSVVGLYTLDMTLDKVRDAIMVGAFVFQPQG